MCLYEGPSDVSKHLEELESRFDLSGYDHYNSQLRGWRAERQLACIRESDLENRRTAPKSKVFEWLLKGNQAWRGTARQAN